MAAEAGESVMIQKCERLENRTLHSNRTDAVDPLT